MSDQQVANNNKISGLGQHALVGVLIGERTGKDFSREILSMMHHFEHAYMPEFTQGTYQGKFWRDIKPSMEVVAEYTGRLYEGIRPPFCYVNKDLQPIRACSLDGDRIRIVSEWFAVTWCYSEQKFQVFKLVGQTEAQEFWAFYIPEGWEWIPGCCHYTEFEWLMEKHRQPQISYAQRRAILEAEQAWSKECISTHTKTLQDAVFAGRTPFIISDSETIAKHGKALQTYQWIERELDKWFPSTEKSMAE